MVIHALDFTVPVEDHAALLYIYIYIYYNVFCWDVIHGVFLRKIYIYINQLEHWYSPLPTT